MFSLGTILTTTGTCKPSPDFIGYIGNNGDSINLQHYLSTEIFGYFLHPDIPVQNPNLKIADIAAGTNRSPLSYATFSLGAYIQCFVTE